MLLVQSNLQTGSLLFRWGVRQYGTLSNDIVPVYVHASKSLLSKARSVAESLGAEILPNLEQIPLCEELFVLQFQSKITQYIHYEKKGKKMKEKNTFTCNFEDGTLRNRIKQQSIANSPLLKAIGFSPSDQEEGSITVLDATAGLAEDSFLMAHYARKVLLVERSPFLYPLLEDGIKRGMQSDCYETRRITEKLQLQNCMDSCSLFDSLKEKHPISHPDVIFLDPMHEEKYGKSALPKFKMQLARKLVGRGDETDHQQLLEKALAVAKSRVIFKRPANAALDPKTNFTVTAGRAVRYDVYSIKTV